MKTEKPVRKQAKVKLESIVEKVEEQPIVEVVDTPIVEEVETVEEVKPTVKEVEKAKPVSTPKVETEEVKVQGARVDVEPSIQLRNIVRVLRKSPTITEVLLKSGDTVQLSTSDYEKLKNPQDPTSIIKHL